MKPINHLLTPIVFALLVFAFSGVSVTAQKQEPESTATLRETMDWIKGHVRSKYGVNYDGPGGTGGYTTQRLREAETKANGCGLTYRQDWEGLAPGVFDAFSVRYITSFSFSDIDPLSIKMEREPAGGPINYWVLMSTSAGTEKVTHSREVLRFSVKENLQVSDDLKTFIKELTSNATSRGK